MVEKLAERKQRELVAIRGKDYYSPPTTRVSDTELFAKLGDKIKVVKR